MILKKYQRNLCTIKIQSICLKKKKHHYEPANSVSVAYLWRTSIWFCPQGTMWNKSLTACSRAEWPDFISNSSSSCSLWGSHPDPCTPVYPSVKWETRQAGRDQLGDISEPWAESNSQFSPMFSDRKQRVTSTGESCASLKRKVIDSDYETPDRKSSMRIFPRPSEIKITWMIVFLVFVSKHEQKFIWGLRDFKF